MSAFLSRCCYSLLFYSLMPFVLLRLWLRGRQAPAYRQRVGERFGLFTAPLFDRKPVWIHAVSVGETLAIAPLVKQFQTLYPDIPVVLTTTTPTGSDRVRDTFGDSVFHVYAPYDLPGSVARFYRRIQPQLVVLMETEVWPTIIAAGKRHNTPVVLANARMSERSARGYQRLSWITRPAFSQLTRVLAQTQADAQRLEVLGVQDCQVTGSVKFDISLSDDLLAEAAELKQQWSNTGQRRVWMAASTHQGEDEIILAAHQQLLKDFPELLLVLVPRHPERFDDVVGLVREAGLQTARRSRGEPVTAEHQVVVGDTMGELSLMLGTADIVFMGGSLVPTGGHNLLEPAAWALPQVSGPHVFNFQLVSDLLCDAGGLVLVENQAALVEQLQHWLQNEQARQQAGHSGKQVVDQNRGAQQRQLDQLVSLLEH